MEQQLESQVTITCNPRYMYAGFWLRVLARFIDGIILCISQVIVGGSLGAAIAFIAGGRGGEIWLSALAGAYLGLYVLGIVAGWLYYTILESSPLQATLGKKAMGIYVTDLNGGRISFGRANGRYWSKILSFMTFGIGFIMAGFTQKKQALHDFIAGTLVKRK